MLLCLIVLVNFVENLENFEGNIDANSNIGQCQKSIDDITKLITATQESNETNYQKDLAAWNAQKTEFHNAFIQTPGLWSSHCGEDGCDPVSDFFTRIDSCDLPGNDLGGGNFNGIDEQTCAKKCRARVDCDYYTWKDANCKLKGAATNPDPNYISGFKTSSGMKTLQNTRLHNNDYFQASGLKQGLYDFQNVGECAEKCQSNALGNKTCRAWTYNKNDKKCWLKHNDGSSICGFKESIIRYKIPDSDPKLIEKIGAKPSKNEAKYNQTTGLSTIVCQDCSQSMGKISTSDSKDVALKQLNNCIANLQGNTTAVSHDSPKSPVSDPNEPPKSNDNKQPDKTSSSPAIVQEVNMDNRRSLYIGLGVGGGLLCILIIGILIYIIAKK